MPRKPLPELEALVGDSVSTVEDLRIEAGKVAEFARAIKANNPVFFDRGVADDRELEAVPAPPTFTRTSFFERYRPDRIDVDLGFDLGFDNDYVVHGEQAYEFERPMYVGDVLSGETTLTDVYQRDGPRGGKMTFAVLETEYTDCSDERVLVERSTRIETSGAIEGQNGEHTVDAGDEPAGEYEQRTDEPNLCEPAPKVNPNDIDVGDSLPKRVVGPLDRKDFVRYAGASGDFSPIHYDEIHATAIGNPSVFGHGMFAAGVAASFVSRWAGVEQVRSFRTRFHSRIWPGDTIRVSGTVTECIRREDKIEIHVDLVVRTPDGGEIVTGDTVALLALA